MFCPIRVDLSFNNIEAIEGLASLVKLTDLVLSNNRIPALTGLDTLTNLEVTVCGVAAHSTPG